MPMTLDQPNGKPGSAAKKQANKQETVDRILDAAEQRIRHCGYNGVSFRDLAKDVGIKSASIHYHFPTKTDLGVAVARRYTDNFQAFLDELDERGLSGSDAIKTAFKMALERDGMMCLCGVLGAESAGLPEEVVIETRRFFTECVRRLTGRNDMSDDRALHIIATLEGAMMMARTLNDDTVFERAIASL